MRVNRFQSTARPSETRAQQEVRPSAPTPAADSLPTELDCLKGYFADSFEPAGAPEVLRQTKEVNCGAAVVTMLSQKAGKDPVSAAQHMDTLESRFTDGRGTDPKELARMLAFEGIEVKKGTANFDMSSVNDALARGEKAVVQVDTNRLATGVDTKVAGDSHWIVVDGKDDQGNYVVKDTGNGSKYAVSGQQLADSVGSAWELHRGGGMLVVGDAAKDADANALAEQSAQRTEALGNTDGGGSRARLSFGRESS
ncbi:cysteine peptidase family C39 domain-containing protein [Pyxidicoccus xibeiensis]|uniref:hypothetical protein n=1 Tax=Pyxidicoccus xibeiensis TaxID=2906759 RepID=UPI0020A7CBC5|nr:hypothetical protein [Pyxidicoccus xibeiensis]MCP3138327.1 hypothetical protein [Pyxidicoccus xibeiensis]